MQTLLKPLYGSEGLEAVTHNSAVITDIGLGQPRFSCYCFSSRKDTRIWM